MSYFPIYPHQQPAGGPPPPLPNSPNQQILALPAAPGPYVQQAHQNTSQMASQQPSHGFQMHYQTQQQLGPPQQLAPQLVGHSLGPFAVVQTPAQPYHQFYHHSTGPSDIYPLHISSPLQPPPQQQQQVHYLQVHSPTIEPVPHAMWPAQPINQSAFVGQIQTAALPMAEPTAGLPPGLTAEDFCHDSCAGNCQRGAQCRFRHPPDGFCPLPKQTCRDFERGQCQRRYCKHFHGTQEALERLAGYALYNPATGQGLYRVQK